MERVYFKTKKPKLLKKDTDIEMVLSKQAYENVRKEVEDLGGRQESSEELSEELEDVEEVDQLVDKKRKIKGAK